MVKHYHHLFSNHKKLQEFAKENFFHEISKSKLIFHIPRRFNPLQEFSSKVLTSQKEKLLSTSPKMLEKKQNKTFLKNDD
eukprot:UN02976